MNNFIAVRNKHRKYYTGVVGNKWAGFGKLKKFPATQAGADEARKVSDHSLEQWVQTSPGVCAFVGNVYTWNQCHLPKE